MSSQSNSSLFSLKHDFYIGNVSQTGEQFKIAIYGADLYHTIGGTGTAAST